MLRCSLVMVAFVSACSAPPVSDDGGTGGGRAGGSGGGSAGGFTIVELDPAARGLFPMAMAVDAAEDRVVVAYFTPKGTQTVQAIDDLNLNVVEWKSGVVSAVQTIRFMQRTAGLAVALHPTTKEPTVAFLGGPDRLLPNAPSVYWFQHDASLATRSGSTWTEVAAATLGDVCAPAGSPMGASIVGLWPALRFDASGRAIFAYRDIHFAQNTTDYTGSDVESMEGTLGALAPRCVFAGFDTKPGRGARLMMTAGPNDETVLVYDQNVKTADGSGEDVVLQRRTATGWTAPQVVLASPNTMTGPQVAWDSLEGYAVAVVRGSVLSYRRSADGTTWDAEETVVSSGSGGWYPSLAMDLINHEPSIAFYDCSASSNVGVTACTTSSDSLKVTRKGGGRWQTPLTVDVEGGVPKLGILSNGRRVIAYRVANTMDDTSRTGVLKLAVER
ncbi:MAG: hypothetical protein GQE15_18995 [Archangiaceae bacterium]|nr:hypothetical protein [Archangiaceae bacterium]